MNCSYAEAEKALAKMEQGDAIFRPSSKVKILREGEELQAALYFERKFE
jgi:hypothetical protein